MPVRLGDDYGEVLWVLVVVLGVQVNGQRMWTWCFRTSLHTLFKIDPTRRADVLLEVLGWQFDGVLGCDCFSADRRYRRQSDVTL